MINLFNSWHHFRLLLAISVFCLFFVNAATVEAQYSYGPVSLHFAKGSAELSDQDIALIKELAETIKGKNIDEIRIEGFSDSLGVSKKNPFADNKSLTLARAENVSRALQAESGLPAPLFQSIGHGDDGAIASNDTVEGRALNRRVEIRVVAKDMIAQEAPATETASSSPPQTQPDKGRITLALRKVDIAEAFEMLSKKERINIVLEKAVAGIISVNLFDVTLKEAIETIATSAGYEAKQTELGYLIQQKVEPIKEEEPQVLTEIRTFSLQYADTEKVATILAKHLSKTGKATALVDRNIIVLEETPAMLDKISLLLKEIDHEPKQILIEAKILEISLDESESFGLDWWKIFTNGDKIVNLGGDGSGSVGVRGLSGSGNGFVFNLVNENVNITLDALNEKGKVKTLSTPKLLTVENQESSVVIGDRKGYNVTTTIDQVTTTSVEFLESGVILKVTPSVDSQNRILLHIHPEVSSGSVTGGIPSQTTTEVSTSFLADNGQTIFIGGLLKKKSDYSKDGVPILGDIPFLGLAFSSTKELQENTETVVLITPYILEKGNEHLMTEEIRKVEQAATDIQKDQTSKVPSGL